MFKKERFMFKVKNIDDFMLGKICAAINLICKAEHYLINGERSPESKGMDYKIIFYAYGYQVRKAIKTIKFWYGCDNIKVHLVNKVIRKR